MYEESSKIKDIFFLKERIHLNYKELKNRDLLLNLIVFDL